jgi:hypothetical protein
MKDKNINIARRQALKSAVTGIAVVSAGSMLPLLNANAAHHEMAKLDENDPAAKGLGYKHDATQVDVSKYPRRAGEAGATQFCDNCNLYTGDVKAEWGGCRIFPNKLVKGKGWCNAWVRK